ncbi:MAG: hypothetical protein P4L33_01970 [Capsulimonadaceae bacterium]|nr:hypothetical protein [Capsulimonadaceae bacterium]
MPKVSRPIIYSGLALAVGLAYIYLNPSTPTATKRTVHSTKLAAVRQDGFTDEDLKAHFPRYAGGARDPFVPGVRQSNEGDQAASSIAGGKSGWALTGVNEVDGDQTAVVENSSTKESVFLKKGQSWNGLKVLSMTDNGILFENALGQQTTLGFAEPQPDKQASANGAGVNSTTPSAAGVEPLPPLPTGGNQRPYAILRRRMRGRDFTEGQNDQ